tara:strand:+ start:5363 stop:5569 length:207 start_codon:yes stop_codon:yes gene_type:complete
MFAGYWFAFNYMLEAYMWARNSTNDKSAKIIQKERESKQLEAQNSYKKLNKDKKQFAVIRALKQPTDR